MLAAELIIKSDSGDKTYELRENRPLFAGRTAECDIYLPSPAVSRRHAVFMTRGGDCGLKDLDSSNGTYLNGKRITKPMRLKNGDVIQIADFVIEFHIPVMSVYDEAQKTVILPEQYREILSHAGIDEAPPSPAETSAEADEPFAEAEESDYIPSSPEPAPVPADEPIPPSPAAETPAALTSPPVPAPLELPPEPAVAAVPPPEPVPSAPKAPPMPRVKLDDIDDGEIGDGAGDAQFLGGETAEPEEEDKELALAKAAAEAGLVGEFVPEVPDTPGDGNGNGAPPPPSAGPAFATDFPEPPEPDPHAIPVDAAFREAIETRLFLYSFLADLRNERDELRAAHANLADAVKSELDRQDREMDKILPNDKAESMIEKRLARREDLKKKIKEAKAAGTPPPPRPSREMREAEEIAINQWTMMAQSFKESLPAVYAEGYRLNGREPLAVVLEESGIDGWMLMGGGAYLLALNVLLEEAKYNRAYVKAKLAGMSPPEAARNEGGGKKLFGLFSKSKDEDEVEEEEPIAPGESYEELTEAEGLLGQRVGWINQELVYIEGLLIKEFWEVYVKVAVAFLPRHEEMTLAARAFLRYGTIGFMPWWMKDEVREHIMDDLANNLVHHVEISKNATNILYADEYLAAVMDMEITPAIDENLEINERNSPNWKADKALRKLINARSQSTLMKELVESLSGRIEEQEGQAAKMDERIANLLPGSKNFKQVKNELSQQRQAYKVEVSKLNNLANKIRNETLAVLQEAITETQERFDSGELPKPPQDFLIKRECDAVHKIGRLLANLKERFLPLVLKDNFVLGQDSVNDRPSMLGEILEFERRDPGLFLENIIPSKKKANRVDLRISPVAVLLPSAGMLCFSWNPRQKPEDGRLGIPTCFIRPRLRERQLTYLLSDFRWDTSKAAAGMDVMNSETIVAAFMSVRWDWRKRSKEGREKGLVYTDQNDRTNWRRVYEAYMQTAYDGGKKLYNRNYDFYERIIGRYFDMPEGIPLLRK